MKPLLTSAVLLLMLVWCVVPVRAQTQVDPLVLIVHPDNPVSDLRFSELRRIVRLDRQYWESGNHISLILPGPVAVERERMLEKVFLASEQSFRQHWISVAYRVQALNLPRPFGDCSVAVRIVRSLENAAALVRASCVDDSVHLVTIDGLGPSDKGYRL